MRSPHPIRFLIFLIAVMIIAAVLSGCKVHKDIQKTTLNTDSIWESKYNILQQEFTEYKSTKESEVNVLRNSRVQFKEKPCPSLPNIDSTCNKDSLVMIIRSQDEIIQSMQNEVEIGANGSIRAKGQILSLNVDLQKLVRESESKELKNQSLSQENDSLKGEIKKIATASSKVIEKKPGGFFSGMWLWLIIGIAIGSSGVAVIKFKKQNKT